MTGPVAPVRAQPSSASVNKPRAMRKPTVARHDSCGKSVVTIDGMSIDSFGHAANAWVRTLARPVTFRVRSDPQAPQ